MSDGLIPNITKSLGTTGIVSTGSGVISLCASAATPAAVMGVWGTAAATAAPFAGLLVLGSVLDWSKGKLNKEATQAEFRKIHAVLARMEAINCDDNEWRGLVDELLEGRVSKTDTAEAFESIADEVRSLLVEQGETITVEMEQGFLGVRIYLTKIAAGIDVLIDGQEDQKGSMVEVKAMLATLLDRSDQDSGGVFDPSRERDLAGALEEVRLLAKRGDKTAISALIDLDQGKAAESMINETRRIRAAKEAAYFAVDAHEIELNREASALALTADDLDGAEETALRVLELVPNDPDTINRLGLIAIERGDFGEGMRRFSELADSTVNDDWKVCGLYNFGVALGKQGDAASGKDRARLRAESIVKYAAVVDVKPDMHEALNNWANGLGKQADSASGEDRARLWSESIVKYAAAVRVKPDYYEALYNWGVVLGKQADAADGTDRVRLRAESIMKYAAVIHVKPDMYAALHNWGNALGQQAEAADGPDHDRLRRESIEKYAAAVRVKSDLHESLHNWGIALVKLALTADGVVRTRLLLEASVKFAAVVGLKPDYYDALHNWGVVLGQQAEEAGNCSETVEACRLLREALDKFERADDGEMINKTKGLISQLCSEC